MAFRKRSFRAAGRKHNYVWGGSANFGYTGVANNAVSIVTIGTITDGALDSTVVRIRGVIDLFQDRIASNLDYLTGAVGIIKVQDAQTTQIPSPYTNFDYDWMWHSFLGKVNESGAALADRTGLDLRIIIDSKAKRRIDDNEKLVLVVENKGATNLNFMYGVRILLDGGKR